VESRPLDQLLRLLDRVPQNLVEDLRELASISREVAPEHGRSTYGEPGEGLTPNDIYTEVHARDFVARARRAREIAVRLFRELNVPTD
jgi:HEPN domain-containing protein